MGQNYSKRYLLFAFFTVHLLLTVIILGFLFALNAKLTQLISLEQVRTYPCSIFKPVLTARVTVTTYNAIVEQTDSNPSTTTFMSRPRPGTVAVSLDLLEMGFIPGKKVWLQGIGIYRVNDVMHERHKMSVDLLLDRKSKHFRADNVLMVMVDEN